ncbi:MAG TPA: hypothetical protein VI072_17595 [Polyangiaceae bacterium]
MKTRIVSLVSVATTLVVGLQATAASAYGFVTHRTIVGHAVRVMRTNPSVSPIPTEATPAEWNAYIADVSAAPAALGNLRSGLTVAGSVWAKAGGTCNWDHSDNLSRIATMKLKDFKYDPARVSPPGMCHAEPTGTCGLYGIPQAGQTFDENYVREHRNMDPPDRANLLGWHAASVDDHEQDSVLWARPTSSDALLGTGVLSAASGLINTGLLGYKFSLLAVSVMAVPFICGVKLIKGEDCELDDGSDLVEQYNPINFAESFIPGIKQPCSSDYVGLWHFINVVGERGEHNDHPGMLYDEAGPVDGGVGAIDFVIMTATDATGLALNAGDADGDDRYGEYDRRNVRSDRQWSSVNLGHQEFSPIDNLALYGYRRFLDNPTEASGLGWPLHAIGDSAAPHHVVGTTSWGHRPYEDYVDHHITELLPEDDAAQHSRILANGFKYWKAMGSGGDVRNLVQVLARNTAAYSRDGGSVTNWAYNDQASWLWHKPIGTDKKGGESMYEPFHSLIPHLLEESAAASLAFLARAAKSARDAGDDPTTRCNTAGANWYYLPHEANGRLGPGECVPGPGPLLIPPAVANPEVCTPSCPDAGVTCSRPCTEGCSADETCFSGCCIMIPE